MMQINLRDGLWKLAGVYTITNSINQMPYVGSTKCFRERYNEHLRFLRNGMHHSLRLQNSWNKYGEDAFAFDAVEVIVDFSNLLMREQFWIDHLNSSDRSKGFNISRVTSHMRLSDLNKQHVKSYLIVSPIGEQFTPGNLAEFCNDHDLDVRSMRKVARHIYSHHRHWRCWECGDAPAQIEHLLDFDEWQNKKDSAVSAQNISDHNTRARFRYILTSPDAVTYDIVNLRQFCRDYGLDNSSMYDVANLKSGSHKGWGVTKSTVEALV